MSEKNDLNLEELEKVSGGVKQVGDINIYDLTDLVSLSIGKKVSVFSGSYSSNSFQYIGDGTITGRLFDCNKNGLVVVTADNSNAKYSFNSFGYSTINGANGNYWFGPQQAIS